MSDVERLGTILGIWAHPDDETYLMGGLAWLASARGQRVACITATAGEVGAADPEFPPERLGPMRKAELAAALDVLGVRDHHWLDYPDGGCDEVDREAAVDRLAAIISDVRPDTVVTFGADGFTGHRDHITVGNWTAAAVGRVAPHLPILVPARTGAWGARFADVHDLLSPFDPGLPLAVAPEELRLDLSLDPPALAAKAEALLAQATQTEPIVDRIGVDRFRAWLDTESFTDRATVARELRRAHAMDGSSHPSVATEGAS